MNSITEGSVGRAVFQSSDWKKINKTPGNAPAGLFIDRKSPLHISVFHLDQAPDEELTSIGDGMAAQRGANRRFYGWAELSVSDAGKNGREVRATPQPDNEWHADIVLPKDAGQDKKEREKHANELALMAKARARDDSA